MNISTQVPSVNFHLWKHCNMKCSFCFATFQDVAHDALPRGHLPRKESLAVVMALSKAGFDKINFAGGEPILCPWLPDLIQVAKELGLTTSVVTNGSFVTPEWLERVDGYLDWAAVSIDTLDPVKLKGMGRITRNGPMSEADYLRVMDLLRQRGIRTKINTVVNRINYDEELAGFITRAEPERWKLLQVLPVIGQNDGLVDTLLITSEEFARYVIRNRYVESRGIVVVPESNDLMTGSYLMVDPAGRFFDNLAGTYVYSRPINQVGVDAALREVAIDTEKFGLRGGLYQWRRASGQHD